MSAAPGNQARLRDITSQQWRSGIAAWLGWTFDGLELHLYTLVAAPVVIGLLGSVAADDSAVKEKSAYIQASFLIGWAIGGGFFGRLGDRLGRSRALALTILTYACCTGLCAFAQTWWQLMIFRFIAALGIGGEWAVGASLLAETWPPSWRPWLAAVLQSGVNLGILFAAAAVWLISRLPHPPPERYVFLLGVLPALLVWWIRRKVEEPEDWRKAETRTGPKPVTADLFRGSLARVTWITTLASALSLSAWWLFVFWHPQHLRRLLAAAGEPAATITQKISAAFFVMIAVSIVGNYFAGWLANRLGNRRAITLMFWALFASMALAFAVPRGFDSLAWFWIPLTGFFSGVFGLFTMYLPPLFPVLLRTTGAGFCYNIGRAAAAIASVVFGWLAPVGDFRVALLASSGLALAAAISAKWLPADAS
ncbi:MAG TPA: MFS transporter [Candidatus Didemnitutus sp.]|nr:MFS transporter [Candidatus Didemnitutus sp.]